MDSAAHTLLDETYGMTAETAVRAPGRVNLIGEHTDYSLLPVLPMAIDRGIDLVGAAADDGRILAISADHSPPLDLATSGAAAPSSDWGVYLHGVLSVLGDRAAGRGARLAVSGDLPTTGGLSSSSALTVGLLTVVDRLWSLELSPDRIVELAIVAERISGVESGGMDQTVIACARPGTALRIDFEPPGLRPVPLPPGAAFVIGYSGSEAAKAGGARDHYNRSVVACRSAAAMLARGRGVDAGTPPLLGRVSDASSTEVGRLPVSATAAAVAAQTGLPVGELVTLTNGTYPPDAEVGVREAARHVLSEAHRVDAAEEALRAGDLEALGMLFDHSHESLRAFGAVTPGLDAVTAAARANGALGARVTGAGFGGWAVAVCGRGRERAVIEAMVGATGGPAFSVEAVGGAL